MLLTTMNEDEIFSELARDFDHLYSSTFPRVSINYDKLRKRKNIPKTDSFHRFYEIKTKSKNQWMLMLSKRSSCRNYNRKNLNVSFLAHYRTRKGITVFKVMPDATGYGCAGITVYNGHFIKRYNERMKLGISNHMDIVKHFFKNNGYGFIKTVERDNEIFIASKIKDGFCLGKLSEIPPFYYMKTFISSMEMKPNQEKEEKELIKVLQIVVDEFNKSNDSGVIKTHTDILHGIS